MIRVRSFTFKGRDRRPPKYAFNALLSHTYTFLKNKLPSNREVHGLDPHLGFLHDPQAGPPSLALDLLKHLLP